MTIEDATTQMPPAHRDSVDAAAFRQRATALIQDVRTTLAQMLGNGERQISKIRDVQDKFGLDYTASRLVYKLVGTDDLLGAAQFVPPASSMQKILKAAFTRGVDKARIDAAENAFKEFEVFVTLHAGDRSRFEAMASGISDGEEAHLSEIEQRKALFKAHVHLWGTELGVKYGADLIGPIDGERKLCAFVHMSYQLNLSRLRPDADTYVAGMRIHHQDPNDPRRAIDQEAMQKHGIPVLPQFSSAIPHLETAVDESGWQRTRLSGESIGLTSNVDLAIAEIIAPSFDPIEALQHSDSVARSVMSRPTRRFCLDVLMHRSVFPRLQGIARMYGHMTVSTIPSHVGKSEWQLPCRERVQFLKPTDDTSFPDVPRRHELLSYICGKMGWSLADFDVYRLDIQYPVLDTMIELRISRS